MNVLDRLRRSLGGAALRVHRFSGRAYGKTFSLLVAGGFASFGARSVVQPPVRLRGERRIAIGDDVYVGTGSWLQVLDAPTGEVAIVIGDGTRMAGNVTLSASASVRIGRRVLIARNVYVSDHMHAFEDVESPVLAQGVTRVLPVVIDDGAWLGENVVVGPGVRIGRGAVIGANSVVLSDVPDHAVAVGAPARVVRRVADGQRDTT